MFWMSMGLIKHFYIIFGTNLLTQSPVPVPVPVFSLFQCFTKKGYQMESKRNETFGKVIFRRSLPPAYIKRTAKNLCCQLADGKERDGPH